MSSKRLGKGINAIINSNSKKNANSSSRPGINKVKINNAKTRWGSCSIENNITLSLQLMRLPDYLIDYVILHELAHTKVKNHSIHFWDFLDSITDSKAKNLDKELKSFYLQVF